MSDQTKDTEKPKQDQTDTSAETEVKVTETVKEAPSRTAPPLPAGTDYIWGTGRRKSAIARVRIRPGKGEYVINKRPADEYFKHEHERNAILEPLQAVRMTGSYDVFVNVKGGGPTGQAGAVSLGLARAISEHVPDCEHDLRDKGLLTRDSRMKERKKPGQPGARKHFQFSKR
jgi:small subunit ribosomal protein S9